MLLEIEDDNGALERLENNFGALKRIQDKEGLEKSDFLFNKCFIITHRG